MYTSVTTRVNRLSAVYARMLGAIVPLILLYAVTMIFSDFTLLTQFVIRLGPIWFITVLCIGALGLLRNDVRFVWTPLFWLPVQSAVFFGFGPLVSVFGNDITKLILAEHYLYVTDQELLWANQLSTVGVASLIFGLCLHQSVNCKKWRNVTSKIRRNSPLLPPKNVVFIFVGLGFFVKYFFVLPAAWGVTNIIVPGFVANLTKIVDVGFAIMTFLAARGDSRMRILFLVIFPIHFILSGLTFSKTDLLSTLLFPALGDLMGRHSLRRFIILLMGVAFFYALSQDFVGYGRAQIMENTGGISEAGYGKRLTISVRYIFGDNSNYAIEEPAWQSYHQGWWARLNYAGVQVAARNLYLADVPNSSFQDAWLYFIPRIIWPDKPVIIGPGWFFYERLTGNEGSFLGLSIYGDLFWFGGWVTTIVGSFLIGWMFSMMSLQSMRFVRDQDFLMFPLVLLPINAAIFGPTNFVANGILALIPLYLAYLILMSFVARTFKSMPRRTSARHTIR